MLNVQRLLEHYPILFQDMIEYNDCFWFVSCNFNGLFKMDKNGRTEYLGKLPIDQECYLCSSIIGHEGKLYFMPGCSKRIIEYDIQKKIFDSYTIPYDYEGEGFYGSGQYQHYIFFWGYVNFDIFRFDMESKEIQLFKDLQLLKKSERKVEFSSNKIWKDFMLWKNFCVVENHIYVPSPSRNMILEINMVDSTTAIHIVPGLKGYITICYNGEKFWLSGLENQLVVWKLDTGTTEVYNVDQSILIRDAVISVYNQSVVYYIFDNSNDILMLHTENVSFEYVQSYKEKHSYKVSKMFYYKILMLKKIHRKIWILNSEDATLQIIENGNRVPYDRMITYGIQKFVNDRLYSYFKNIRYEEGSCFDFNLEDYIYFMPITFIDQNDDYDKKIGEKIFQMTSK